MSPCTICLRPFWKPVTWGKCGHIYCFTCYISFIEEKKKYKSATCPLCISHPLVLDADILVSLATFDIDAHKRGITSLAEMDSTSLNIHKQEVLSDCISIYILVDETYPNDERNEEYKIILDSSIVELLNVCIDGYNTVLDIETANNLWKYGNDLVRDTVWKYVDKEAFNVRYGDRIERLIESDMFKPFTYTWNANVDEMLWLLVKKIDDVEIQSLLLSFYYLVNLSLTMSPSFFLRFTFHPFFN